MSNDSGKTKESSIKDLGGSAEGELGAEDLEKASGGKMINRPGDPCDNNGGCDSLVVISRAKQLTVRITLP